MTKGDVARFFILVGVAAGVAYVAWLDARAGTGLKGWLTPQTVLSTAGLIVGFIVVSWQLKRQHWNTLDNNRRQSQDRLNVELYNKIAERIEATAVPLAEVGNTPTAFIGELIVRDSAARAGRGVPKSTYFEEMDKARRAAHDSVISLMSVLETHAIVMPEFAVLRTELAQSLLRLNASTHDFRAAAWQFAGPGSEVHHWPPSEDEKQMLNQLAGAVSPATIAVLGVIWDLRVAGQNQLLGRLFPGQQVPPRVPGDPSVKVTSVPPRPEL
jgi:hypothetical protein